MRVLSLVRRVTAITLIGVFLPLTYAAAACAGWSSSAAERHACCERPGSGCASISADECCAASEGRQHLETVTLAVVTPGAAVSQPVPPFAAPPRSFVRDPRSLAERPDTYLLDSVFLI